MLEYSWVWLSKGNHHGKSRQYLFSSDRPIDFKIELLQTLKKGP